MTIDRQCLPDRPILADDREPGEPNRHDVATRWLVRLRSAAIAVQALLALVAGGAGWLPDPATVAVLVGLQALSNAALAVAGGRASAWLGVHALPLVLLADIVLLTAVLAVSGGPSNPFSVVYLVYVTLAAVTLGSAWTWSVALAAIAGYACLFRWHLPLSGHALHEGAVPSHLAGMWLAFAATACLTAWFVTGVTRTLAAREGELARVRDLAARNQRLASLTTLAAGVAHELATPLGSIAVAARELERSAEAQGAGPVVEDTRLIRAEVERCRVILDRMSGRAGPDWIEPRGRVDMASVVTALQSSLPADRASRLRIGAEAGGDLVVPGTGLVQALVNLLTNAFDAMPADGVVALSTAEQGDEVVFVVRDSGSGMLPDVLARAGEPFYTTKAVGAGFGLGLFLVRTFAERHGGRFDLDSDPGRGTTATLTLPRQAMS